MTEYGSYTVNIKITYVMYIKISVIIFAGISLNYFVLYSSSKLHGTNWHIYIQNK